VTDRKNEIEITHNLQADLTAVSTPLLRIIWLVLILPQVT